MLLYIDTLKSSVVSTSGSHLEGSSREMVSTLTPFVKPTKCYAPAGQSPSTDFQNQRSSKGRTSSLGFLKGI